MTFSNGSCVNAFKILQIWLPAHIWIYAKLCIKLTSGVPAVAAVAWLERFRVLLRLKLYVYNISSLTLAAIWDIIVEND